MHRKVRVPLIDEAGEVPPGGEEDGGERWVRVGEGGLRDQGAGAQEVKRGGNVVAGFIPEVGKAQQGKVGEIDEDEEEWVENPERQGALYRCGDRGEFRAGGHGGSGDWLTEPS